MASVKKVTGPAAPALLLLAALLAPGARADDVTMTGCNAGHVWERVRQYPTDSKATFLSMSNCGLTEINPDTFTGLPNLKTIYLHNNNIENINPAVFSAVPSLTKLELNSSKLRELPVFDQHSCPNLTELYLTFNELTGIHNAGTFSACARLEMLELSYSHIGFIHFDAFSGLTELQHLYLNNNKIRFIPDQMFVGNGKLKVLLLMNNRITHLPPDFASSLKQVYVYDNPWHCACLLELLADAQRAGVSYDKGWDYYYDGGRPVCNYISMREYPCRKIRELNFIAHGVR